LGVPRMLVDARVTGDTQSGKSAADIQRV
jgi:hypothetical protein